MIAATDSTPDFDHALSELSSVIHSAPAMYAGLAFLLAFFFVLWGISANGELTRLLAISGACLTTGLMLVAVYFLLNGGE